MKEQIKRIIGETDKPETRIEKIVSINFDTRQYFIRIPKKISEYLKINKGNKVKIIIDIPLMEEIGKKIMVVEILEEE